MIQFVHRKFKEWTVHPDNLAKKAIVNFKEVRNVEPYFVRKKRQWCHCRTCAEHVNLKVKVKPCGRGNLLKDPFPHLRLLLKPLEANAQGTLVRSETPPTKFGRTFV